MKTRSLASEFIAPLPLSAVVLLGLNDHLLKGSGLLPSWLTGKLSDVAGLFFFPLFLSALVGLVTRRPANMRRVWWCAVLTMLFFAALQVSPLVAGSYLALHRALVPGWPFALTPDLTDLLALPASLGAVFWARRHLFCEVPGK